jgi:surface polysaccharide O-acyltransferase-like enzyme
VAKRSAAWIGLAAIFYAAILVLVYAHHHWVADFNAPPFWWEAAYSLTFALFGAAMTFAEPAIFLRFAKSSLRLLDAIRPSAYGIFLVHYIFIIWLQYIVYEPEWSPFVKFAIVFVGTLSLSWATALLLRRIPFVARMI